MITDNTIDRTILYNDYCQLIHYYTSILNNNERKTKNDSVIIMSLYYLTFDMNFLSYMKIDLHLTPLFPRLKGG